MATFKIDGNMAFSSPVLAAGHSAVGLWLRCGSWSAGAGTYGFIPQDVASSLGTRRLIKRLLDAGLWELAGDGYEMTDVVLWDIDDGRVRRKIPRRVREAVYARDGHRCRTCLAEGPLELDHIFPWSLGGTDDEHNLQTLCGPCNREKGARV